MKYSYTFGRGASMQAVSDTLTLALLALEALNGASRLRLDARFELDQDARTCTIAADTAVGEDLNLVFVGLVRREFGDGAFTVARTASPEAANLEPVAA